MSYSYLVAFLRIVPVLPVSRHFSSTCTSTSRLSSLWVSSYYYCPSLVSPVFHSPLNGRLSSLLAFISLLLDVYCLFWLSLYSYCIPLPSPVPLRPPWLLSSFPSTGWPLSTLRTPPSPTFSPTAMALFRFSEAPFYIRDFQMVVEEIG